MTHILITAKQAQELSRSMYHARDAKDNLIYVDERVVTDKTRMPCPPVGLYYVSLSLVCWFSDITNLDYARLSLDMRCPDQFFKEMKYV